MAAARRKRPRPKPTEIAAAVAVVLAGVGLIAAIVLLDPRWQRLLALQRDGVAVGPPATIAPAVPEAPASHGPAALPGPAASPPAPTRPARAESTPVAINPARQLPSDTTQVMASLLVSQLGFELAWRTAAANAEAHGAGTPEHAYWRGVSSAIRESHRPRP
jgi:hypothetical protein